MLIFSSGFEDQNLSFARIPSGAYEPEIFTSPLHSGDYSVRMQSRRAGHHDRGLYVPVPAGVTDLWAGCQAQWNFSTSHRVMVFLVGGVPIFEVLRMTSLALKFMPDLNSSSLTSDVSTGISLGNSAWHDIKVRALRGSDSGQIWLYYKGDLVLHVPEVVELGLNESPGDFNEVGFVGRSGTTTGTTNYSYFDDIWVAETDFGSPLTPSLVPDADGFYTEGSPLSAGTGTAEIGSPFSDASYITLGAGERNSFTFDDTQLQSFSPVLIGGLTFTFRFSGPGTLEVFARLGGTDYTLGSATNISTAFATRFITSMENPATSSLWTASDIASAEFGVREASS